MDKRILDLVADFSLWRGDSYRLAAMVADKQREIAREALIAAGHPEAAVLICWHYSPAATGTL